MNYVLRYSARIAALVMSTVSGVFFLIQFGLVLWLYHEMPGTITKSDLIASAVFGACLLCSGIAYYFLACNPRPK